MYIGSSIFIEITLCQMDKSIALIIDRRILPVKQSLHDTIKMCKYTLNIHPHSTTSRVARRGSIGEAGPLI